MNKIQLIHGDALVELGKLPENSVDLTVTSPPYDNLRTYNNSFVWSEKTWKSIIEKLYKVTVKGGVVVWVVGDSTIEGSETGTSFKQALYAKECGFNLHDTMIWEKHSFNHDPRNRRYKQHFEYVFIWSKGKPKTYNEIKDIPVKSAGKRKKSSKRLSNGKIRDYGYILMKDFQARSNIWKISPERSGIHPAPFPEQLAKDHILSWSNEGDTVLDCFMGSGTTGVGCVNTNRNFIGIEKEKEYIDISKKRIEQAQAEKESNLAL